MSLIVVVVPARLAATRLPRKPLAEIAGAPMIVHVLRRGAEAGLGPVVAAVCEAEVADAVEAAGFQAVMTDPDLPSGSDRCLAAIAAAGLDAEIVVNLQGDLPTIAPDAIRAAADLLRTPDTDIGTLAAPIADPAERDDPNVVKAVVALADGAAAGRALYFSRAAVPAGDGPLLHHIGLYAWRRTALEAFVAAPPGVLERRERLEQLRALEMGMRIDCAIVDDTPLGVDTPADLEAARAWAART